MCVCVGGCVGVGVRCKVGVSVYMSVCVGEVILITTNFTKSVTETKLKASACIGMEEIVFAE